MTLEHFGTEEQSSASKRPVLYALSFESFSENEKSSNAAIFIVAVKSALPI